MNSHSYPEETHVVWRARCLSRFLPQCHLNTSPVQTSLIYIIYVIIYMVFVCSPLCLWVEKKLLVRVHKYNREERPFMCITERKKGKSE